MSGQRKPAPNLQAEVRRLQAQIDAQVSGLPVPTGRFNGGFAFDSAASQPVGTLGLVVTWSNYYPLVGFATSSPTTDGEVIWDGADGVTLVQSGWYVAQIEIDFTAALTSFGSLNIRLDDPTAGTVVPLPVGMTQIITPPMVTYINASGNNSVTVGSPSSATVTYASMSFTPLFALS